MHLYHFHLSDGTVKSVNTSKHHSHDYADDIVKWFNDHKEDLEKIAITALTVVAISHSNFVIWKKPT